MSPVRMKERSPAGGRHAARSASAHARPAGARTARLREAFAAAALTAVTLTGVTLVVDRGRGDVVEPAPADLVAAAPARQPVLEPLPPVAPAEPTEPEVAAPADPAPAAPRRVDVGSTEVFVADYETGDFSQWGTCQSALLNGSCDDLGGGDRTMKVVEAATPDGGRYAARFAVRNGDVPEFGGGERAEVSENKAGAQTREGDERWYEWSMRLPEDFSEPTGGWFIVMQWHGGSGSPPLAIDLSQGSVDIGGDGTSSPRRTIGPMRPGEWVDYVMHVRFSRSSSTGFVEAWENGEQTVPRTSRATMSSSENYLKQGIYRDEGAGDGPTEVQFAGLRVTAP